MILPPIEFDTRNDWKIDSKKIYCLLIIITARKTGCRVKHFCVRELMHFETAPVVSSSRNPIETRGENVDGVSARVAGGGRWNRLALCLQIKQAKFTWDLWHSVCSYPRSLPSVLRRRCAPFDRYTSVCVLGSTPIAFSHTNRKFRDKRDTSLELRRW